MTTPVAVIKKQYAAWVKEAMTEDKNFIILPDETNFMIWYALVFISDPENPMYKAEIIFKLTLPDDYPANPPSVVCLTETGQFVIGSKICVGIGEYHKDNYNPSLGLPGFVHYIFCYTMNYDDLDKSAQHGLSIIVSTPEERRMYARHTRRYNSSTSGLKEISERFETFITKYKVLKPVTSILELRK